MAFILRVTYELLSEPFLGLSQFLRLFLILFVDAFAGFNVVECINLRIRAIFTVLIVSLSELFTEKFIEIVYYLGINFGRNAIRLLCAFQVSFLVAFNTLEEPH